MYKNHYVSVIIAAAGMSNRMGSKINKQFISIDNKPILAHTIEKFERCRYVDEIIVVAREDEIDYCRKEIVRRFKFNKVTKIVRGGKERQDSAYNGILALNERSNIVLSHDGARPFVKIKSIVDGIEGAIKYGACVIGVPVKDTIKVVKDHNNIDITPKRDLLWAAQTPQCFKKEIIMEGYRKAINDNFMGTDDSSLVERLGMEVKMIMGSYENIKITTPEDLIIAESILKDKGTIFRRKEFVFQSR
ncbi:2-C-methyl-D-erythritol 4-phosphate cytidylyltransferase [[Clostridium] ultunense Esp]|uniref:2-C-methyl-D-erythritol 4-phosphate cytidylyltransferase n=1 Tax=[Clostridium] ultunense Esp TaxID=1288971 RepID=M1Z913_9FIRM|nr:2-C-methyl-D-erythritol 4-phosphate cytidylyltransferase [Schnuerera ultunensis]CCQ94264.1 2-C-methyl-D-erythritol 4-phosphate cytidylyltransferase [[Clostridium] ultunense Esp]SHD78616.1 2-C-methyl-D-erythritol 4-phosphate cytidylyltransferase, nonmevalonate isoprenoid pathway [[Clostridium] ultunense Esp]